MTSIRLIRSRKHYNGTGQIDWLYSKKFRLHPIKETFEKCMIKCIRVRAGLGNPPKKWVNNLSESMNNIIKEPINYNAVNTVRFYRDNKRKRFSATERRANSLNSWYGRVSTDTRMI